MLDKLLSAAATNVKLVLAAAAGAALVAGGSAVAISNVADSDTPTGTTSSQNLRGTDHASEQGKANRSDTATVGITLPAPKPAEGDKPDEPKTEASHGACVSAAVHKAQEGTATGQGRRRQRR
ncbi:MAG: hypothetical protein LC779_11860 [Actinobacteria bacterium]|nr:hypothetical protein [Actinomycetota bacterium]